MKLIITEKPSVARDLTEVLTGPFKRNAGYYESKEYVISWCIGHMARLVPPEKYKPEWKRWDAALLPIIPQKFELEAGEKTIEHWKVLKRLLTENRFETVINACDAGREGELIFRYVHELAGSKIPIQRLWLSSMTRAAIEKAFTNIRPSHEFDNLYFAARSRSEADWLVGLNASRAMTVHAQANGHQGLKSLGRVQTPTLAMIVERDAEIASHQPEKFFQLIGTFQQNASEWEGVLLRKETENRIFSKHEAHSILKELQQLNQAEVVSIEAKIKEVQPPALYDLSTLQREANVKYGLTAQETLTAAQGLYEQKVLTYPRTDSRYLSADMKPGMDSILNAIEPSISGLEDVFETIRSECRAIENSVFNDDEVTDHHAIIPTDLAISLEARAKFSAHQLIVYELVARRLVGQFLGNARFNTAKIETHVGAHQFLATGQFLEHAGWQVVDPPHSKKKEKILPMVTKGTARLAQAELQEGKTKPPPQFTEASLLGALENAGGKLEEKELRAAMKGVGLGTAATRASIIETLLKRKYIERSKKNLVSTPLGQQLIRSLAIEDLKSPFLTATWEADLLRIEKGQYDRQAFMERVYELTRRLVKAIPCGSVHFTVEDSLGACPLCQKPVRDTGKVYSCTSGRDCNFLIFHEIAQKKITSAHVKKLINKEVVGPLNGFKSRAGKDFSASLVLDGNGRVQFQFNTKEA